MQTKDYEMIEMIEIKRGKPRVIHTYQTTPERPLEWYESVVKHNNLMRGSINLQYALKVVED